MNDRQWRYRVNHRLCWKCNFSLSKNDFFYGWICPLCNNHYSEKLLKNYEDEIKEV
jgi:hypothetical protein